MIHMTIRSGRIGIQQGLRQLLYGLTVLCVAGCQSPPQKGATQNEPLPPLQLTATFTNTTLEFSLKFDPRWHFYSEQRIKKTGMNNNLQIESDAQDQQIALISRFSPDKPDRFNDNLSITAESLTQYPTVSHSSDFLIKLRDVLRQSNSNMKFQNVYDTDINGKTFSVLSLSASVYGIKVKQTHYATLSEGKVIDFILTYAAKEREADLQAMIKTLKFDAVQPRESNPSTQLSVEGSPTKE